MDRNQRILRERNQRIRKALELKPFVPQKRTNGLTSVDIYNIMKGKKAALASEATPSIRKAVRERPQQVRREVRTTDLRLLLDIPSYVGSRTIEWPTPDWFRCTGDVDASVVIPMYKSVDVLVDLIQSLELENSGLRVEFIFVDDHCPIGSKSKVIELWEGRRKELRGPVGRIYYNSTNQGFGSSCNVGVWHSKGKNVVILNADTVVTKGWLKPIVRLLRDESVGVVGNLQLKRGGVWDGTIDSAGSEWNWEHATFLHIGRHTYQGTPLVSPMSLQDAPSDLKQVAEREMVTGCCMGFNRKTFLELGGFDQNYRIGYWEDSDLCLRFREKGYKVLFQPNSRIYHKLGHTGSGSHQYHDHNRNYFFNKWVNSGRIDPLVTTKRTKEPKIHSVLLQRQAARGDVLLAAAVAPALVKKYGCQVVFNTRCPEVLEGNPHISRIVNNETVSERQSQLILNLDMAYEFRPGTNILQAYADAVGVEVKDCIPFLKTEPVDILDDYIVIHAGKTNWVGRDWSPMKFNVIASRLMSQGQKVVCIGSGDDHHVACTLDLRGKTSIPQLSYVIQNSKLFVGIDSFPMHVAQVFDVPGVIFFGSVIPATRLYRDNMVGVAADLPCLGCHHRKPPPSVVTNACENDSLDCVNRLSVNEFWKAVEGKLAG